MGVSEEAAYRVQIHSSASQVFFSYLSADEDLLLSNPLASPSEKRSFETEEDADKKDNDNDNTKRLKTE
jgi:hypothetical protein